MSNRIEREKKTIARMLGIYCADRHGTSGGLCDECRALLDYATKRVIKCVFGAGKPQCAKCVIHCYKPEMRERVKEVMRYSGPRMLTRHPYLAVMHMLDGLRKPHRHPHT